MESLANNHTDSGELLTEQLHIKISNEELAINKPFFLKLKELVNDQKTNINAARNNRENSRERIQSYKNSIFHSYQIEKGLQSYQFDNDDENEKRLERVLSSESKITIQAQGSNKLAPLIPEIKRVAHEIGIYQKMIIKYFKITSKYQQTNLKEDIIALLEKTEKQATIYKDAIKKFGIKDELIKKCQNEIKEIADQLLARKVVLLVNTQPLNELRGAMAHVVRYFTSGHTDEINKAKSHISRALLDTVKHQIILLQSIANYFDEEIINHNLNRTASYNILQQQVLVQRIDASICDHNHSDKGETIIVFKACLQIYEKLLVESKSILAPILVNKV